MSSKKDAFGERCGNRFARLVWGGCFIESTLVTVSSLPGQSTSTDSLWSDPSWLDEPSQETPWLAPERYASVATRTELKFPIESVPIGARVPTKNPNRFEVDPQPEPDQATWAKLSITVERSDGGIVDAEIIRPRSWILRNGICAGRMLPFNLPELEVSGLALVTAIDDCPPIADGEGSVVTARFVTREVHIVASVDMLGADGTVETITGTTIHPVWSVDRQEWVPLAELAEGETLQGLDGLAVVLSVTLSRVSQPVYNNEAHGEHVYQVGELGLVVHNACPVDLSIVNGNHFHLIDDLLKASSQADRNGLTLAGRALQKHGDRVGSVFPKSFGDLSTRNAHGQAILEGILRSSQQTTRANRYGGFDVFNVLTGRGARFDSLGKFIGFLDP